jgi:hypothetical protein
MLALFALQGGLYALEHQRLSGSRHGQLADVKGLANLRICPRRTLGALVGFQQNLGASALGGGRFTLGDQTLEYVTLVWKQMDCITFGWHKTSLTPRGDGTSVARITRSALHINLTVVKD